MQGPTGPTATPTAPSSGDRKRETMEHLASFARSRVGVEAYIEPPNSNEPVSILLIATTGEWTRRRVPSAVDARKIAGELGLPVYDVNFTGYPQRMRDWNSKNKRTR
ncbi:oxidoreductase [Timonella senegalensis]|uniref:oxidoreductase n=1 Tax=Timonella senegalensis TaxID=1465825 RepID=UPI0028A8CA80|nr:oxidoreductase [Timonella senegalensis]